MSINIDCGCDPDGSTSLQCNENDGTCSCKTNYVGTKCDTQVGARIAG